MAIDPTLKQDVYNNSSYSANFASKKALYDKSQYAQTQELIAQSAKNKKTKTTSYTLPNGRVLMRYPTASRIDFKSLFGSITNNDNGSADTLAIMKNMKASSDSILEAYSKRSKQNLGLS